MSAKRPTGCFFLDSSILIPEILALNNARIRKLKKDVLSHKIDCYFSESVRVETEKKVTDTINFLGNAIKNTLVLQLESSRRMHGISLSDPITNDDILDLEEFFYSYHGVARALRTLTDPVSLVEEWIISFLSDKLDKGNTVTISDLANELVTSVLRLSVGIQDSFDFLVTFEKSFVKKKIIPVDPRLVRIIASLQAIGIHSPDSDHIANATMNQILSLEKTVFVTLDFSTILNQRGNIIAAHGIMCSDPLYALHHLQK